LSSRKQTRPPQGGGRPGQSGSARKMVRAQLARERRRQRTIWTSVIALAVLLVAGLIGWGIWASQRSGEWTAPAGASADGTGIVVGSGPVTVDIYEDFICPACGQFEQRAGATLDQLVTEKKVRIVYHPVAYLDRFSTTDYSTRSSAASGCAAEGGKFREYARALFQQQPPEGGAGLSDDQLVSIAGSAGLDTGTFGSCLRDRTYRPWTQHVTDAASRAGITGTPTVLVAGKPVESSAEAITAAVAAAGG
jgi:protein-disulfide isomerase